MQRNVDVMAEMDTDTFDSELSTITGISSDGSRSNSRMDVHEEVCDSLNYFVRYFDINKTYFAAEESTTKTSNVCQCKSPTPILKSQSKMKYFLDNVSGAESDKIDMMLAAFFYACNVPFLAADSKYFKKFLNVLRPAYNPPSRQRLASKLLDKTNDRIEQQNSQMIAKMGKQVSLLVDGWQNSSTNRHNVVVMLATAEDQKVFLESYDFSTGRETGERLAKTVKEAIELAKNRYDAEVYAVISDHASAMESMGAAAASAGLWFSTCNAHAGNLLAGDILKTTKYDKIMSSRFKSCLNCWIPWQN